MRLRVFLPPADRLDAATSLAWTLFDARGEVLRRDAAPLAGLPRAEEVELALPAARVLFARLKLPRVNAATIRELLPYAVEDRLLADPSHIHAVAGPTNARGETLVAVVDRDWLEGIVRAFRSHGLRPRHAWCECALLAGGKDDWHAVLGESQGFLVDDDGVAVVFDRPPGGELPLSIRVAVDEASGRGARPSVVRLHSDGAQVPDLARWGEQAGISFAAGTTWREVADGPVPREAIDLLRGISTAPESGAASAIPRAAMILVASMALLQLAFTAADAWRLQRAYDAIAARQEAVFRAAFPEARTVVDPALQMSRNLADLQRSRGLPASDDFLAQATRAARDGPPGGAKSLAYANGKLEVRR